MHQHYNILDIVYIIYYTLAEGLAELMKEAGFEVIENSYVQKETVNMKEGISAPRVFLQGRFMRPILATDC